MHDLALLTADTIDRAPLAEPGKIRKLQDGGGLFIQIDARSKAWRFRYRFAGKDCLMSLGVYPIVSIDAAREEAQFCREVLARHENPADVRKRERNVAWTAAANTFGKVSAEYIKTLEHRESKTIVRATRLRNFAGKFHSQTLTVLGRPELLAMCRSLERDSKYETAHRLGTFFCQVFRYARDEGIFTGNDPTQGGFSRSLIPVPSKNRPAITDRRMLGVLIRDLDGEFHRIGPNVRNALRLLMRTFVRPGELAEAQWSEFDLDGKRHDGAPTWIIPLHRMKMKDNNRTDHIVPLSRQSAAILREQYELTGHGKYVFVNARGSARFITLNAMGDALDRLVAFENLDPAHQHDTSICVPHGFRTTAKTLIQDDLRIASELVERQLAHKVGNSVASAYDKSQRLAERRDMMQQYADLLDTLKAAPLDHTAPDTQVSAHYGATV